MVALVRTLILVSYMVTNGFIIANAIRHWNPLDTDPKVCYDKTT
jgi:hypothetical protein